MGPLRRKLQFHRPADLRLILKRHGTAFRFSGFPDLFESESNARNVNTNKYTEKHLPVSGFYKPWLLKKRISATEKCQK